MPGLESEIARLERIKAEWARFEQLAEEYERQQAAERAWWEALAADQ